MHSIVLLFFLQSLAALGGKVFTKLCSHSIAGRSTCAYALFLTVNGLVACVFFFISGGLAIHLNLSTLIYSILYAAVITLSLIASILAYKHATVAAVSIIPTGFSLLGSMLIGYAFFEEAIGARTVARVAVMLCASLLIFLDQRKHRVSPTEVKKKKLAPTIAVFTAVILFGYGNTIVTKSFAISPHVTDANSFFFMTNALIVIGALLVLLVEGLKSRESLQASLFLLKPKSLLSLSGNTVCSNVGSLLSLRLVALMDVSLYTPIASAVGILLAIVGSWIFRERLGLYSYLAAAVACVAILL